MRVFAAFFFTAVGVVIVLSSGESSAQDIVPMPAQTVADGVVAAPVDHCVGRSGIFHRGYLCGASATCGCGANGNCACQGSYKYPVPTQYTYFWPGIYSQQAMTQYVSPWRNPGLNPIPENWKVESTDEHNPYSGYRY